MQNTVEFRWYQDEAEKAIYTYYKTNKGNPIVALPTGTGKSVVIGKFIWGIFQRWPTQRIIQLAHRKELLIQNSNKLKELWPAAPFGLFSAGLKQKNAHMPITFGGIQSCHNAKDEFCYKVDLIIVDEAHLINPKDVGMYAEFIRHLKAINPFLKVIGFTATDYRMGQGRLTDEMLDDQGNNTALFTDVIYDLTDIKGWALLIEQGYLCKLVARATNTKIDISNVKVTKGEFNIKQLADATDTQWVNTQVVDEMCRLAEDRWAWLVFGIDIEHCEHLATLFQQRNYAIEAVHSKLTDKQNDARLSAFRRGELRGLVNNDKLTTGMDHPPIDCIGMVRHTMSPSLWVQMAGRGTRPYDFNNPKQYIPGYEFVKNDCLLLDYARNCERLGPINNPVIPKQPNPKGGDMPVKICPKCGVYNFAAARVCDFCGHEFPINIHLETASDATAVFIDTGEDVVERIPVFQAGYSRYQKSPETTPMLRVVYLTGHTKFTRIIENIMIEKDSARKHCERWWKQRHPMPCPSLIDEALKYHRQLKTPRFLTAITKTDGRWRKYPDIQSVEF